MHLKEWLDKKGLKYTWFADKVGVPYKTIWNLINGISDTKLSLAMKIEKATKKNVRCEDIHRKWLEKNEKKDKKAAQQDHD